MARAATKPDSTAEALPGAFGSEAERAIREAQAALSDLITEAGLEGVRAVDLARTLKLDKTLAWKLARFTASTIRECGTRRCPQ